MKEFMQFSRNPILRLNYKVTAFVFMLAMMISGVWAVTVKVVGPTGEAVSGFRWLVEEDKTFHIKPGVLDPATLAVRFHTSYMPVVKNGYEPTSTAVINLDPSKYYYISVLPDSASSDVGYSNGGVQIEPLQTEATALCQKTPLPTAQISVFVFEDINPINNEPDLPEERPLEGFKVVLYEAGGRYGQNGGQVMMDAFGNPLGTTYDMDMNPTMMGDGVFLTDKNGEVLIKNLYRGKYTVEVIPPAGQDWHQTTTIEGLHGVDAWVKPNEPKYFQEFGPPGWHVFHGFVHTLKDTTVLNGTNKITGRVTNLHTARPPDYTFWSGAPVPAAWVGLNELSTGNGKGVFTTKCNPDSTFSIPNVPPGAYQLVIWDDNLDVIFGSTTVTVKPGEDLVLGDVPVFSWFGQMQHVVYSDLNENGIRDTGEPGIVDMPIILHFRDGSLYQSYTTNEEGIAEFREIFPFFNWLVAECDISRYKPTGATFVTDNGGQVLPDQGWDYPSRGVLNPQPQFMEDGVTPLINPKTGNNLSRTEHNNTVATEAFQLFLGQTSIMEWGKSDFSKVDSDNIPKGNFPGAEDVDWNNNECIDGTNGGIAGSIWYGITRAENDPRYAAHEGWEPGIPRVQVNLYQDFNNDTIIDDLNGDSVVTLCDIDNYPFDNFPGTEDTDRNNNGQFDLGDAMNTVHTDGWDDTPPTGAQGPPFIAHGVPTDCYDGLRNFNQSRPGIFDGSYLFATKAPDSKEPLPEGYYIIEANVPPGYEIQKEEDKNVDFGETYTPAMEMLPPICVGDPRIVPAELKLFPGVECVYAGQTRPMPDRKQVVLAKTMTALCDFTMFTEVPISGHIVGIILDDTANEFDPNAPTFSEKYSPPWLPISLQDWTGKEIGRTYSDEWGAYNALVPGTFTINPPFPSGVSPNMVTVVLNHPGPILDKDPGSSTFGQYITDPFFNRQYSQFSYTFQYTNGTTTYLDTPVVKIAAFAGPDQFPLDCDEPDGTPLIYSVQGSNGGGPFVTGTGVNITVVSAGKLDVPNPLYDPNNSTQPKTIKRDYGFGATPGTISIGGISLQNVTWTDGVITGRVASGTKTGQLMVTRSNGKTTPMGVTVTVGPITGSVLNVYPSSNPADTPIQDAIDIAHPGDLILVAPGQYNECVIMYKPVQLQGWGAMSVLINAVKTPAEKLDNWRQKVANLIITGGFDLLPGQAIETGENTGMALENALFNDVEGAGIAVFSLNAPQSQGGFGQNPNARIDGFTITGSDNGGGIFVNGYAHYLEISNCKILNNQGFYCGGIRIGHPSLTVETQGVLEYDSCRNDHINIHHNHIMENGALDGVGAGISIYAGADNYLITENDICGNFTEGNGAGIGQLGYCEDGIISHNEITFNQSFMQQNGVSGGGIYIAGNAPLAGSTVSPGAGCIKIDSNLIQGNQAGAGNGGGIALVSTNGQDIIDSPDNPAAWCSIDIFNNIIANNMSGLAGGGISLQDAVKVNIVNNTIVRNDSTATAGAAFAAGSPNLSTAQPAGIASYAHSSDLRNAIGNSAPVQQYKTFSNPMLYNDIILHNRAFHFYVDNSRTPAFGLDPSPLSPNYFDLGVIGTASPALMNPMYCGLTNYAGYDLSNRNNPDPVFVSAYFNGARGQTLIITETTTMIEVAPAFDEGGNYIDVRFGPLTLYNPTTGNLLGDYHIQATSQLREFASNYPLGLFSDLMKDIDEESRPSGGVDAGADEYYAPGNAVTNAPWAQNDLYTLRVNQRITISSPGVLANDFNPVNSTMRATIVQRTTHGSINLNSNGSFTYRPNNNFIGTDSFTYHVNNGRGNSNDALVLLRVTQAGNQRPVAYSDIYNVERNSILNVPAIGIMLNDSDPDGDTIFAQRRDNVRRGSLTFRANGSFTYTPRNNFSGVDRFTYRVYDGLNSNTVTVTINVGRAGQTQNAPPAPTSNGIVTTMNMPGYTRVIPNDPNPYDTFTYYITAPPLNGTSTITQTGILNFIPNNGFVGNTSVIVMVVDQSGAAGSINLPITVEMMPMGKTPFALQYPPDTDGIDTDGDGIVDNDHVYMHLGAGDGFAKMADGKILYTFGFVDLTNTPVENTMMEGMLGGNSPAPTIVLKEGQKFFLNLTNLGMAMRPDLFDAHTVHFHGFPQAASVFDGVPDASWAVNMGSTFTYFYDIIEPGTFMYHCHVEAPEHIQMGMVGNLYVRPKQDGQDYEYPVGSGKHYTKFAYNDGDGSTGYDVDFPIQLSGYDPFFHDEELNIQPVPLYLMDDKYGTLNGRSYPDTINPDPLPPLAENGGKVSQSVSSLIKAKKGERILLRLSNLSVTKVFTLTSPSIPLNIVGKDARILRGPTGKNLYYQTNSVTIGAGEADDAILDTSALSPGTYYLYSSNLYFLSNDKQDFGGMMTEIVIE